MFFLLSIKKGETRPTALHWTAINVTCGHLAQISYLMVSGISTTNRSRISFDGRRQPKKCSIFSPSYSTVVWNHTKMSHFNFCAKNFLLLFTLLFTAIFENETFLRFWNNVHHPSLLSSPNFLMAIENYKAYF